MTELFTGEGPVLPSRLALRRSAGLTWSLVVPYKPTSKKNSSQRMKRGKFIKQEPSEAAKAAEAFVRGFALSKRPRRLLGFHLIIEVEHRFRIPKTGDNRRRRIGEYRLPTPDTGNCDSLIHDALKGVVYADDAVLVETPSRKVWWTNDETLVVVTEIEPFPAMTTDVIAINQEST